MDEIMNNIEVTPENVFEVLNRLVEKEQITFDLAINEAKRATDEIFGRLYGGDKLDLQELRKLLSLAVQYEHQLFHWLDSPIHFYYQKHKEYPLRIKEFRLKCIADLQTAQKVIESKLEWKKEDQPKTNQTIINRELKMTTKSDEETAKQRADKYYAWYHKILIKIGKAERFTSGDKKGIVDFGKNKYNTKSGFYQAFMEFNTERFESHEKRDSFVNTMSDKERKKWKSIIIEISKNDIGVINYLKKFPD